MLGPNWNLVKQVAAELLEKRRLSGDEVAEICEMDRAA
jgi:hypothetical protein